MIHAIRNTYTGARVTFDSPDAAEAFLFKVTALGIGSGLWRENVHEYRGTVVEPALTDGLRLLAKYGHKIAAIKVLRVVHGGDLKTAKDFVDALL